MLKLASWLNASFAGRWIVDGLQSTVPASPLICHPWLASGLILYLVVAAALSLRGFVRRTRSLPASTRERIAQWMRTTLASLEPTLVWLGVRPSQLTSAQLGMSLLAGAADATGRTVFAPGWGVVSQHWLESSLLPAHSLPPHSESRAPGSANQPDCTLTRACSHDHPGGAVTPSADGQG